MLSQQTEMDPTNSEIMDQIRKFIENFEKLQSELTVAKQMNSVCLFFFYFSFLSL